MPFILIVLLGILLVFSAFFSASETSLFSIPRAQVSALGDSGGHTGRRIARALERPSHLLTTILTGNTLVNVATAAVATALFSMLMGPEGVAVAIVASTVLLLIFGEIVPKTIAVSFALPVARLLVGPLYLFSQAVRPVTYAVASFSNFVLSSLSLVSRDELESRPAVGPSELRMLMHEVDEAEGFTREARRIAMNILEFAETRVDEIMTPRVDIAAVDAGKDREEVEAFMKAAKHSRIPVFRNSVDGIVGFLSTKEFFLWPERPLESLIKPVLFVPSCRRLEGLLHEMQRKGTFMVVVVNEYGETLGLVTKEDILEEVVGEIYDEYEAHEVPVRRLEDGTFVVDGRADLDLVSDALGVSLRDTEAVTLSGFIFEALGRVPSRGDSVERAGHRFEVMGVKRNRVTRCKIRRLGR
ncbi:MAG: HlyC/CorC family transporter [Candidatus Eiseniibacteriota bacterium]|nr:MAG: HlyC/CorC family transporter [Candidatus Eisenbacteria bacterium]